MRFDDPARPQNVPGSFMYVAKSGKPIAVLPSIMTVPLSDMDVMVSIMLLVGPSTARWFERVIRLTELVWFLEKWMEDPEEVLLKVFDYDYEPGAPENRKDVLSLEDLGL